MAKIDKKKLAKACEGWQNAVVNQLCDENLPKKPEDWARLSETQAEKAFEENNKLLPYAFAEILKNETEALKKMFPNNKQNTEIMKINTKCVSKDSICLYKNEKGECNDFNIRSKYCTGEAQKEKTTVFVVMTGDTPERAFSSEELADMFITTHERDYNTYIQPIELDKADKYFDPEQYAKEEKTEKNAFSAYDKHEQDSGKVPPTTHYGECAHPQNFCDLRNNKGECTDDSIRAQFCKYNTEKTTENTEERVNHPKHYQHPSGVECITVARHHDFNTGNALKYIFRAGLKQEQGLSTYQKQIEDLQKAVFYIQDEIQFLQTKQQEQ